MKETNAIAIVGAGTMGQAIAHGLLHSGEAAPERLRGTVRHEERALGVSQALGVPIGTDNPECVRQAEVVLLCVKPHLVGTVMSELSAAQALDHDPLVVSIAAGVGTREIEAASGRPLRVVRAMPNTPALIGADMTVVSGGAHAAP